MSLRSVLSVSAVSHLWHSDEKTPMQTFQQAIKDGDVALLDKLLPATNLQQTLPNGELPLHYAIRCSTSDVVQRMLDADSVDLTQKDDQGLTALDHAFLSGDSMKALVLGHLVGVGFEETKKALVHAGTKKLDAVIKEMKAKGQVADEKGRTALHYAFLKEDMAEVKGLIEKGLNPLEEDQDGITPLMIGLHRAKQSSHSRDPSRLGVMETLMGVGIIAGWAESYYGAGTVPGLDVVSTATRAIPLLLLCKDYKNILGAGGMMFLERKIPALAVATQVMRTYSVAKNSFAGLSRAWRNCELDPGRSLRNAVVHGVNASYSVKNVAEGTSRAYSWVKSWVPLLAFSSDRAESVSRAYSWVKSWMYLYSLFLDKLDPSVLSVKNRDLLGRCKNWGGSDEQCMLEVIYRDHSRKHFMNNHCKGGGDACQSSIEIKEAVQDFAIERCLARGELFERCSVDAYLAAERYVKPGKTDPEVKDCLQTARTVEAIRQDFWDSCYKRNDHLVNKKTYKWSTCLSEVEEHDNRREGFLEKCAGNRGVEACLDDFRIREGERATALEDFVDVCAADEVRKSCDLEQREFASRWDTFMAKCGQTFEACKNSFEKRERSFRDCIERIKSSGNLSYRERDKYCHAKVDYDNLSWYQRFTMKAPKLEDYRRKFSFPDFEGWGFKGFDGWEFKGSTKEESTANSCNPPKVDTPWAELDPENCSDHARHILGLSDNFTDLDCKSAYNQLMKKYHPDRNSATDANERTREIVSARDRLCPRN